MERFISRRGLFHAELISRRAPPEGGYAKEQRAQRWLRHGKRRKMAALWNTKDGFAIEYEKRWLRHGNTKEWLRH